MRTRRKRGFKVFNKIDSDLFAVCGPTPTWKPYSATKVNVITDRRDWGPYTVFTSEAAAKSFAARMRRIGHRTLVVLPVLYVSSRRRILKQNGENTIHVVELLKVNAGCLDVDAVALAEEFQIQRVKEQV